MGTRSVIARQTGPAGERGFVGRYHHFDGYPDGLGETLFTLYHGHFQRDLPAMLKYLIDDHPAGWSSILRADFTQPAGYPQGGTTRGPNCYCHGGRSEEAQEITHLDAADCGCEFAYVFDAEKNRMLVLSSFSQDGSKMIGYFGCGDKNAVWKVIGNVDLTDPQPPKWEEMEEPLAEYQDQSA